MATLMVIFFSFLFLSIISRTVRQALRTFGLTEAGIDGSVSKDKYVMSRAARPGSGQQTRYAELADSRQCHPEVLRSHSFHMACILGISGEPLSPSLPVVVGGMLLCLM